MKKTPSKTTGKKTSEKLYTLKVTLMSGPVNDEFFDENPEVSRTIQILGSQTLENFHDSIFTAFDRFDEHLYEFQFGSKMHARDTVRYIMPYEPSDMTSSDNIAGSVCKTSIDSLNLKDGETFFYWFDFGDDWMHEVFVISVDTDSSGGKYPKITERIGDSPPQYSELEDDDGPGHELEDDDDIEDKYYSRYSSENKYSDYGGLMAGYHDDESYE